MVSIFEQLLGLARPYTPVTLTMGEVDIPCQARNLSAEEEDVADLVFKTHYTQILAEKRGDGTKPSEADTVRAIYVTRPKEDLVEQLLVTRDRKSVV